MGPSDLCPETPPSWIERATRDVPSTVILWPTAVEGKLAMWRNAINQCRGDNTNCPFLQHKHYIWRPKDGDAALETLMLVISAAEDLIQNCRPDADSEQTNESFHAVKSDYCGKRLNFWTSSPAQVAMVVIDHSKQPRWQDSLRGVLDVRAISRPCPLALMANRVRQISLLMTRRTAAYRAFTGTKRAESRPSHRGENKEKQTIRVEIERETRDKHKPICSANHQVHYCTKYLFCPTIMDVMFRGLYGGAGRQSHSKHKD
jgi:hypothetical protein